ncbi:hypothetical protein BDF22DRAFT_745026 [Syncephalis plumigaleata]|nr:hypothetical protein BDF22DRAFT_745026 [Syncephalis plumigaleata]
MEASDQQLPPPLTDPSPTTPTGGGGGGAVSPSAANTGSISAASSPSGNGMTAQEPATFNPAGIPPEIVPIAQRFFTFTNKVYMRGLLNKKNDIMPDGKPFSVRDWTSWYVELRGPVLTFWTTTDLVGDAARLQLLHDPQVLSAHKSQTIPNYINITDSVAEVIGMFEDRQFVLSLNTAGANRFYLEATGPQVMLAWVRCIRLACYEVTHLCEIYTQALMSRPAFSKGASTRSGKRTEGWLQARATGSTEWKKYWTVIDVAGPVPRVVFMDSKRSKKPIFVMTNISQAYAIYPEKPQLVDLSTIHKLEGLVLHGEDSSPVPAFVQLMAPAPAEMARWLCAVHDAFYLYGCPGMPQIIPLPDEHNLYLDPAEVADVPVDGHSLAATKQIFDRIANEKQQQRHRSPATSNSGSSAASPFAPRPPTMSRSNNSSSQHPNMQHSGIFAPSSHRQGHVHQPSLHNPSGSGPMPPPPPPPVNPMNPNYYSPPPLGNNGPPLPHPPPHPIQHQMNVPSPPGSRNSSLSDRAPHNRPPLSHNPSNMSVSSNHQYVPPPQQNVINPMVHNHVGTTNPGHTANSSISSNNNSQDRQLPITNTSSISPPMALSSLPEIPSISGDLMGDGLHGLSLTEKDTKSEKKEEKPQRRRKPARPLASDSEEEEDDDDDDDEDNEEDDEDEDEPAEKKKEVAAPVKPSPPVSQTSPPIIHPSSDLLPPIGGLISSDINLSFLNVDPHAAESAVTSTKADTSSTTAKPATEESAAEAPLSAAAKRRNRRLAKAQAPLPSDSEEDDDDDDDDDDGENKPNLPMTTTTINTTGNNPILGTSNANASTQSLGMNEAMDSIARPRTGSVPMLSEGRRPSMPFDWQSNNSETTLPSMQSGRPQSAHLLESGPAYPAMTMNAANVGVGAGVGGTFNQMRPMSHAMGSTFDPMQPMPGMEFMTPEERWRWEQQQLQLQQQQMYMAQSGGIMQPPMAPFMGHNRISMFSQGSGSVYGGGMGSGPGSAYGDDNQSIVNGMRPNPHNMGYTNEHMQRMHIAQEAGFDYTGMQMGDFKPPQNSLLAAHDAAKQHQSVYGLPGMSGISGNVGGQRSGPLVQLKEKRKQAQTTGLVGAIHAREQMKAANKYSNAAYGNQPRHDPDRERERALDREKERWLEQQRQSTFMQDEMMRRRATNMTPVGGANMSMMQGMPMGQNPNMMMMMRPNMTMMDDGDDVSLMNFSQLQLQQQQQQQQQQAMMNASNAGGFGLVGGQLPNHSASNILDGSLLGIPSSFMHNHASPASSPGLMPITGLEDSINSMSLNKREPDQVMQQQKHVRHSSRGNLENISNISDDDDDDDEDEEDDDDEDSDSEGSVDDDLRGPPGSRSTTQLQVITEVTPDLVDIFDQFVDEQLEMRPYSFVPAAQLYSAYKLYCRTKGASEIANETVLEEMMTDNGFLKKRRTAVSGKKGRRSASSKEAPASGEEEWYNIALVS